MERARDRLVRQRTQHANAIRGMLYEMGLTASKGAGGIAALLQRIESSDAAIPPALLQALAPLARQWREADAVVAAGDKQILALDRENHAAHRIWKHQGRLEPSGVGQEGVRKRRGV